MSVFELTEFSIFQTRLQNNGIKYEDSMLKPRLLVLVKLHKPTSTYAVDEIIRRHAQKSYDSRPTVLEFNAIEHIWSQIQETVHQRNVTFRYII